MKRRTWIIIGVVAAVAAAALFLTYWNKAWWIARAVRKWNMKVDGKGADAFVSADPAAQRDQPSWRMSWLVQQPLRRLRELYDTGTLK